MVTRMHISKQRVAAAVALALTTAWGTAQADAPGQSFWVPGQVAAFAALPANGGWTVNLQPYYYSGDISENLGGGYDSRTVKFKTDSAIVQASLLYGFTETVGGGRMTVGLNTGYGKTKGTLSTNDGLSESESASGNFTSFNPYGSWSWRDDSNHFSLYLTGAIPTGSYDSNRVINSALGFSAIDGGFAYTMFDRKSGWEASVLAGATYNWTNNRWRDLAGGSVSYQNGADWHVDYSVSKFVSPHLSLGLAGYAYGQFTDDKLNGIKLDNSRSHIAGIGPQATYVFRVNGRDWTINVRGYAEFWQKARPEGYTVMTTLSMPLGSL